MLACVFDFLDGFAARGLDQGSPMGKELDSLADMVTFGVVPGMVMFQMIQFAHEARVLAGEFDWTVYLPYIGFIVPLFSALRLAKFNVDTRQSESFIGLPTLANALFICGLPLLFELNNSEMYQFTGKNYLLQDYAPGTMEALSDMQYALQNFWQSQVTLVAVSIVMSILCIVPMRMFSFKIKSLKWKGNEIRYIFLLITGALFAMLKLAALPMVIVVYIIMSVIYAITKRSEKHIL